jgi:fumarylacetoacetase
MSISSSMTAEKAVSAAQALNSTHDPALRSWVESANRPGVDFPIQNLPFGVFRRAESREDFRGAVAIGDQVLDLQALAVLGVVSRSAADALHECT